MPEIENIHHIALLTDEYEKSKDFYINILGFTMLKETFRAERNSYKLDMALHGKYVIELFSFPDVKERSSFPEAKGLRHLAFAVKNIDEWFEFLRSKNIETENIRLDTLTNKRFLFFNDPNGQPLEFYEL